MRAKVEGIPAGYQTVTPSLSVTGAREAIEFYKRAFGAEEKNRLLGPGGAVIHARLKLGDSFLLIGEAMDGRPLTCGVHLYVADADALWARATAAGAEVLVPIADMFWGDRYGVLGDRWGQRWSIATHQEDVPAEEMGRRAAEAMRATPRR